MNWLQNKGSVVVQAVLMVEAESLNREIYRLQLERDVLEKAAETIKKDQVVDMTPKSLTFWGHIIYELVF